MSWVQDMQRQRQLGTFGQPLGRANETTQTPAIQGGPPAPATVSITDLGTTDTGTATAGNAYTDPELKQIDAMLRAGGFPETESREYWQKRIHETSGKIDDYWTKRMAAGPSGQAQFHGGDTGGGLTGDLVAPFSEPYAAGAPYAAFNPPSGQDLLNEDPGYKFRLGEGQQALEQSAAARGILNTGGTLKNILNYGQSAASQEYKNAYDRALGRYQTNYRTQYSDPEDARYRDYLTRYEIFRSNQNDPFNKYYSVAQLGANASR